MKITFPGGKQVRQHKGVVEPRILLASGPRAQPEFQNPQPSNTRLYPEARISRSRQPAEDWTLERNSPMLPNSSAGGESKYSDASWDSSRYR